MRRSAARWYGEVGCPLIGQAHTMIGLSLTPVCHAPDPAWFLAQLATLTGWLEASPDRWPPWRTACALRAIHAGDTKWRDRAAEVRR